MAPLSTTLSLKLLPPSSPTRTPFRTNLDSLPPRSLWCPPSMLPGCPVQPPQIKRVHETCSVCTLLTQAMTSAKHQGKRASQRESQEEMPRVRQPQRTCLPPWFRTQSQCRLGEVPVRPAGTPSSVLNFSAYLLSRPSRFCSSLPRRELESRTCCGPITTQKRPS